MSKIDSFYYTTPPRGRSKSVYCVQLVLLNNFVSTNEAKSRVIELFRQQCIEFEKLNLKSI